MKTLREADPRTLSRLVSDLDSDDPAVRLFSIHTLERLTGDRMGYNFYDDEDDRKPALRRWQDWLAQRQGAPATRPIKGFAPVLAGDQPGGAL